MQRSRETAMGGWQISISYNLYLPFLSVETERGSWRLPPKKSLAEVPSGGAGEADEVEAY